MQHICAKCFQKGGAERSQPDTSGSCPHSDRKWQSNMHTLMPHRSARPIVMCDWEAVDTQNEVEYLAALASWGDLIEEVEMCPGVWASEGRRVSQVWTTSTGARLGRMVSVHTSLMKVKQGVWSDRYTMHQAISVGVPLGWVR